MGTEFGLGFFVCWLVGWWGFLFVWQHFTACRILVPQPGIEPVPLAVEARSLNHWTTREFPGTEFQFGMMKKFQRWMVVMVG